MRTLKINQIIKLITITLITIVSLSSCGYKGSKENTSKSITIKVTKPKLDIHDAILKENFEVLEQHILAKTDINKKEAMSGSSPLLTAVTFNKPAMVKALLKAKVDLSIKNNDGSTALHTAAFFGRIDMVKMLLDAGADKTAKNNFGATPREIVLGEFSQMKPIYEMLIMQLEPMGFKLDLKEVEKARPVIAVMLQ